ncbi:MAG: elongation factor P [Candidatus Calescibacterium sp.]|nr:elongation factor P [Candidatus Calescibacterium sp.]MCX7972081.1 elongation factor P [bacterium]MDW8194634.1 elongation factor P [Candidatus Calescibacterium sp.]
MLITPNDFHKGVVIEYDGSLWQVVDYQHTKIAQAKAFVATKIKNLKTGQVLEKKFDSEEKFKRAIIETKPMQLLYRDSEAIYLMDNETFEQYSIPLEAVRRELGFIKDGDTVDVMFYEGNPIGISLPPTVTLKVEYTEKAVKGDRVSTVMKPATLETGITINVPIFVDIGDSVVVNTETGEYVSRA